MRRAPWSAAAAGERDRRRRGNAAGARPMHEPGQHADGQRRADDDADGNVDAGLGEDAERRAEQHAAQGGAQAGGRDAREQMGADPDAGQRADEDVGHQREVDVAADPVRDAGDPQQDRGVEDVGADDPVRGQAEDEDQREPDQRAAAHRGGAEHEAEDEADRDGEDLRRAREVHAVALARDELGHQQRTREDRDRDHEQRPADGAEQHRVEVVAVGVVQAVDQPHADQRAGHAAAGQPLRDAHVDRARAPVAPAAEGLGDGAVGEVGADRDDGLDADDDDQQRRHQRAATDPGHPDQDADTESEDDDEGVHAPAGPVARRRTRLRRE